MINNLKLSKFDSILVYLCCPVPDVYMVPMWVVREQSRSLPKVFMWNFCSTESSLWQPLYQKKLFYLHPFFKESVEALAGAVWKKCSNVSGMLVPMWLMASICTPVAPKVCYKTGTSCISSMKAAKQTHTCEVINVKDVLWAGSESDLGRMYCWQAVGLKSLSGETTANLIEIKDIKTKRAKKKEANSAFPSTHTAYHLLILLAQLLRYGVCCQWAAVRMGPVGTVLLLGGNNCQLW